MRDASPTSARYFMRAHALRLLAGAAVGLGGFLATPAAAQLRENPVFLDDSASSDAALAALPEQIRLGNFAEAVRSLQSLLDHEGERVLPVAGSDGLYLPVRRLVHERLLANRDLLAAYRERVTPAAADLLAAGDDAGVEARFLLTTPGFEATLRLAQCHLEAARFHQAARTLGQLARHPDLRGDRAAAAADLAARIAAYLPSAHPLAVRMAEAAGIEAPSPAEPPSAPAEPIAHPLEPAGPLHPESLVERPLSSAALTPEEGGSVAGDRRTAARMRGQDAQPWSLPLVDGDTVYVNDGNTVSALDRFTLRPRWRFEAPPREGERIPRGFPGRLLDDTNSVTLAGPYALAATGRMAVTEPRAGELVALERGTGRIAWSVDVSKLDPAFEGSGVRGPVAVDGQTVVVALRRAERGRRVVASRLIGLDLADGSLLWSRSLASAGAQPFQHAQRGGDAVLVRDGVAYMQDDLGIAAAIETATGRLLWLRRLPVGAFEPEMVPVWVLRQPVLLPPAAGSDAERLVLLGPNNSRLLALDAGTGAILLDRPAEPLGEPRTLLRVGDRLALLRGDRVAFLPIDDLDAAPLQVLLDPFGQAAGRAVAAGESLLVPVRSREGASAALAVNARTGEITPTPLQEVGNLAVADGQLLTVTEERVHSYLGWETASRILAQRMRSFPADPEPATALAELAFRSGRHARIAEGVEAGIAALDRLPDDARSRQLRRRLFEAVLTMVDASQSGWDETGRPDDASAAQRARGPVIDDLTILDPLVVRLEALAQTPEDVVAQRVALGRLRTAQGRPAEAIDAYQELLTRPALAGATWRGDDLAVRAEIEAAQRVLALVRRNGAEIYAPYEERARQQAAQASARDAETIARAYPAFSGTPALWLAVAEQRAREERPHAALRALRSALAAADTLRAAGAAPSPGVVGEIAGRLTLALAGFDRPREATEMLARVRKDFPGARPTAGGQPIDPRSALAAAERTAPRLPLIGPRIADPERPQILPGKLLEPLARRGSEPPTDRALVFSRTHGALAAYAADPSDPARLAPVWSRQVAAEPLLLRWTPDAAWLYFPEQVGGYIERIDLASGEAVWRAERFDQLAADLPRRGRAAPAADRGEDIVLPTGEPVSRNQVVIAMSDRTIALVERSGRAVGLDAASGEVLWSTLLPTDRVHDADLSGGILAVAGSVPTRRPNAEAARSPSVVALDARTGEQIHRLEDLPGDVGWLRLQPNGEAVAALFTEDALGGSLVSVDLIDGRLRWTMTGEPAQGAHDAWVFGDDLYILSPARQLWLASAETGALRPDPLDTRARLDRRQTIHARRLGDDVLFTSGSGSVIFAPGGRLVGLDALENAGFGLPALVTRDRLVSLNADLPTGRTDGQRWFLSFLTPASAKLEEQLPMRLMTVPSAIAAIDGAVLVTTGDGTMVIRAPAE